MTDGSESVPTGGRIIRAGWQETPLVFVERVPGSNQLRGARCQDNQQTENLIRLAAASKNTNLNKKDTNVTDLKRQETKGPIPTQFYLLY